MGVPPWLWKPPMNNWWVSSHPLGPLTPRRPKVAPQGEVTKAPGDVQPPSHWNGGYPCFHQICWKTIIIGKLSSVFTMVFPSSLDWFKGKSTRNPISGGKDPWFPKKNPVDFPRKPIHRYKETDGTRWCMEECGDTWVQRGHEANHNVGIVVLWGLYYCGICRYKPSELEKRKPWGIMLQPHVNHGWSVRFPSMDCDNHRYIG